MRVQLVADVESGLHWQFGFEWAPKVREFARWYTQWLVGMRFSSLLGLTVRRIPAGEEGHQ